MNEKILMKFSNNNIKYQLILHKQNSGKLSLTWASAKMSNVKHDFGNCTLRKSRFQSFLAISTIYESVFMGVCMALIMCVMLEDPNGSGILMLRNDGTNYFWEGFFFHT